MSSPITWQNVAAPNFADAFRGMAQAQQGMDGAFTGLEDLIKKREATDAANWTQGKTNNTNELLNGVLEPKTPEEFAAREAQLRQQLTGYGAQVDSVAARGALDSRLSTLQQRATAGWAYDNAATDQKEAPIRDQIMSAINRNDPLTANIIKSGSPNLRNMAAIEAAQTAAQRQIHSDGQNDVTFSNQQAIERDRALKAPVELSKLEEDIKTQRAQQTLMRAQAEHARQQANTTKAQGSAEALAKGALLAAHKDGIYGAGEYGTAEGKKALMLGLKELNFKPAQMDDLLYNLGQDFPNGIDTGKKDTNGKSIYVPLPISFILDAASRSDDNSFAFPSMGFSRRGDNTVNLMAGDLKGDTGVRENIARMLDVKNKLFTDPLEAPRMGSHVPGAASVDTGKPVDVASMSTALKGAYGNQAAPPIYAERAAKRLAAAQAEAEKKSPEITEPIPARPGSTAVPLNRAAAPVVSANQGKPSVVNHTEGFSLGNPSTKVAPLDTSKVVWGQAEQVVKANIDQRKAHSVVLTVASGGVKDGDTIKFNNGAAHGLLNDVCRIDGIDARETAKDWKKNPEPGQAYGDEATDILKKMIDGKQLQVTVTQSKDGTGSRSVCQVDIVGGDNLSAGLVKAGAAYLVERFRNTPETALQTGNREALRVFQQNAIQNKLGMFGDTNPRNLDTGIPADYRKRMKRLNPSQ